MLSIYGLMVSKALQGADAEPRKGTSCMRRVVGRGRDPKPCLPFASHTCSAMAKPRRASGVTKPCLRPIYQILDGFVMVKERIRHFENRSIVEFSHIKRSKL